MSEDQMRQQTEEQFGKLPGFQPMQEYYAAHRKRLDQE
jgi:hypothetical protein